MAVITTPRSKCIKGNITRIIYSVAIATNINTAPDIIHIFESKKFIATQTVIEITGETISRTGIASFGEWGVVLIRGTGYTARGRYLIVCITFGTCN